ncbi:hypothetical protein ACMHYJ_16790 [Castellaniella hirudinis]
MKTFTEWATHYGYDDTPEARADYERYQAELALFKRLASKPEPEPDSPEP